MRTHLQATLFLPFLVLPLDAITGAPGFEGIGDLPGGGTGSFAYGVSSDGATVVGQAFGQFGPEAYRWRPDEGILRLGDLGPGTGPFNSIAHGVSGDGMRVVGRGVPSATKQYATYWNEDRGIHSLGALGSTDFKTSKILAANADGSWMVGTSTVDNGGFRAILWRDGFNPTSLGVLAPPAAIVPPDAVVSFFNSQANDISPNGNHIVGHSASLAIQQNPAWIIYCTPISPTYQGCGPVQVEVTDPNHPDVTTFQDWYGIATARPDNEFAIDFSLTQAFAWSTTGTIQSLDPNPSPNGYSAAHAVSADGTIIVGTTNWEHLATEGWDDSFSAAIWTKNGASYQVQHLGDLPGGAHHCELVDISDDGTMAVGFGSSEISTAPQQLLLQIAQLEEANPSPGSPEYELLQDLLDALAAYGPPEPVDRPVIWCEATGLLQLDSALKQWGVDLSGWELVEATAISADGDVIVGNGVHDGNLEGWRITGARALFGIAPSTVVTPELTFATGRVLSHSTQPNHLYQVEVSDDQSSWADLGPEFSTVGRQTSGTRHLVLPVGTPEFTRVTGSDSGIEHETGEGTVLSFLCQPGHVYTGQSSIDLSIWEVLPESIDAGAELFPHPRSFYFPHSTSPSLTPPTLFFQVGAELSGAAAE